MLHRTSRRHCRTLIQQRPVGRVGSLTKSQSYRARKGPSGELVGNQGRFPSSVDVDMAIPASSLQITAATEILGYGYLPSPELSNFLELESHYSSLEPQGKGFRNLRFFFKSENLKYRRTSLTLDRISSSKSQQTSFLIVKH